MSGAVYKDCTGREQMNERGGRLSQRGWSREAMVALAEPIPKHTGPGGRLVCASLKVIQEPKFRNRVEAAWAESSQDESATRRPAAESTVAVTALTIAKAMEATWPVGSWVRMCVTLPSARL